MPDGPPKLWGPPQDARRASQAGAINGFQPGPSRRASRGFFSLFSSSKRQQQPPAQVMRPHYSKSTLPSNLPDRFDAISLTSPSQRDDPAFSRDPSVHHAHPVLAAPRRDFIRTSAPASDQHPLRLLAPAVAVHLEHSVPEQHYISPGANAHDNNLGARYEYNNSSFASSSSLALPPSNDSFASSPMSPSSSSSFLSHLPPPVDIPSDPSKAREDAAPALVTSPLTETYGGVHSVDIEEERPMSPPPDYEDIATPRPLIPRNDSAPELRRIEPPGLPHRSATAPISAASATVPRRANDRRPQAYDLDRIDELDESNPLGVALHHEGPFQAIASVLKGPSPLNQSMPPQMRPARAPNPGNGYNGGSLGISPGQVLPRNFQYYQPPIQPTFRQDYNGPPQASTSYLPPTQHEQRNMLASPVGQEDGRSQLYPGQPPSHVHPSYDARYAPPPLPLAQPTTPSYDPRSSWIPPQTQYDPVDALPPAQNGNPYHSQFMQQPSSHHATHSSEDMDAAYGGIEVDPTPKRDRRSAPPARTEPYFAQNGGSDTFPPRRHSAHPGFTPPVDPRGFQDPNRLDTGQNLSNLRHSPNGHPIGGFIDPRVLQNGEQPSAGQALSGMRRSPQPPTEFNDSRFQQQQYPAPQVAGYDHPRQGSHTRPDDHDRRRPTSYQPQPTTQQPPQNLNHASFQPQIGQQPMAEHDPRRRVSYQPAPPPPGAAPVDLGRQQFEPTPYQKSSPPMQGRQQSVAPSIASSANPRRGPLPQHIPKHLVMPTPLQQTAQLPRHPPAQSYPAEHYSSPPQQVRFDLSQQAQPTRAQTIQMVQDGGRHLLRKRSSVVTPSSAAVPLKAPPVTRSYMEPPPTAPGSSVPRPVQQEKKRPKRLLSKRRADL
ncbi:hypothetical protein DFH09DRAFT_1269944 [Mycena vulgaris]|nr:hypothetical protein DFH09DRAFT_1269944 [Mycena vulgaris]